jgi:Transposase DDE domain
VKTKKILSMKVTDEHAHDSKQLSELVDEIIESDSITAIGKLFADGAYEGNDVFRYLRHGHNSILLIFILDSISSASPKHILY